MYTFLSKSEVVTFEALGDLTWNDPYIFTNNITNMSISTSMSISMIMSIEYEYVHTNIKSNILHFESSEVGWGRGARQKQSPETLLSSNMVDDASKIAPLFEQALSHF